MTDRASWWSITINNPMDSDRDALSKPPSFVKLIKYQDEIGEEGTLHIQGAIQTTQVRFSQVKKWLTRAHIEIARDKNALLKYVEKSETAINGTQFTSKQEFLTTAKALRKLASYYTSPTEEDYSLCKYDSVLAVRRAYWRAVRDIVAQDEELISLYCRPDMLRAWENTSSVWLKKIQDEDRQTDRQERLEAEQDLSGNPRPIPEK